MVPLARLQWRSGEADMPTIWEDPAGKGYPCFEWPLTLKEANAMIERFGTRIVELESAIDAWMASPSPETEQMVMDTRALSTPVTEAAQERADQLLADDLDYVSGKPLE
jgi:hypothetical protein